MVNWLDHLTILDHYSSLARSPTHQMMEALIQRSIEGADYLIPTTTHIGSCHQIVEGILSVFELPKVVEQEASFSSMMVARFPVRLRNALSVLGHTLKGSTVDHSLPI